MRKGIYLFKKIYGFILRRIINKIIMVLAIHQYESAVDMCVPSHLPPHRNFSDGDLTATKCAHLIL